MAVAVAWTAKLSILPNTRGLPYPAQRMVYFAESHPKSVRFAVAAIAAFETKMNFGHIPSTLLRDQHSCTSEQQLILRPTETMVATLGQN